MYLFAPEATILEQMLQAPVTSAIVLITVAVSLLAFSNPDINRMLIFNTYPIQRSNQWYRFFSHGLIHGDGLHLAFNMFSFWTFGGVVENAYLILFEDKGWIFYLLLYVLGLAMASIYSFYKHKDNPYYSALGASGAVSGVVFAFILIAPTQKLMLMLIPIPIPAFIFGGVYLIFSHVMAKRNMDNIGHDAHFWGAVWGFAFTACLKLDLLYSFFNQIFN